MITFLVWLCHAKKHFYPHNCASWRHCRQRVRAVRMFRRQHDAAKAKPKRGTDAAQQSFAQEKSQRDFFDGLIPLFHRGGYLFVSGLYLKIVDLKLGLLLDKGRKP